MDENEKSCPSMIRNSRLLVCSCAATLAILSVILIFKTPKWIRNAKLRAFMADVKSGTRTTVYAPDPSLLEDSLKDREFVLRLNMIGITSDRDFNDHRLSLLKQFPNLKTIWIEYAGDSDVFLNHIQGMANLEELRFHHAWFTAKGAQLLGTFPELKRLSLDRATDATLSQISGMTRLQELELDYGNISDASVEHLKNLTHLKKLSLWYTGLTSRGIASLQKMLPNCEITVNKAGEE